MRIFWSLTLLSLFLITYQQRIPCSSLGTHIYYKNPENETQRIEKCICPLDVKGNSCNTERKFECITTLLTPVLDCSKWTRETFGRKEISGDYPCLWKNSTTDLLFETKIECNFREISMDYSDLPNTTFTNVRTGFVYDNLTQIFDSMKYFVRKENDTFALSKRYTFPFTFKPVNFVQFGDKTGLERKILSPKQFLTQETISYTLSGKLPEEFYSGNRLYMEIGFIQKTQGMDRNLLQIFIDILDKTEPEAPFDWYTLIYWLLVSFGSVIGSIVFIILSFYFLKPEKHH